MNTLYDNVSSNHLGLILQRINHKTLTRICATMVIRDAFVCDA